MNKSDFFYGLMIRNHLTEKQSTDVVNLIFDSFTKELKNGGKIEIRGLGSFSARKYKSYKGRNPKTGKTINVKSKKVPFFKAGLEIKNRINGITTNKIDKLIHYCNSYDVLPTLIDAYEKRKISHDELLVAFRENWSRFDNIASYQCEIEDIFCCFGKGKSTIYLMMNKEERKYYKELPDTVTIYRGCDENNQDGICWSLNRDIAIEFPFLHRYKAENPVLVTATISKNDIVAVKLDRKEYEVIIAGCPEIITLIPLTEADRNPKIRE